jgi:hypothetical protein
METETRWDLTVRRNDPVWERPLRIIGPNLTGIDLRAQIRNAADTPGPPVADLALVTNGNAEGVRLASVTEQADGTWANDVRIRLNKSTRQAFKYEGEVGDTATLVWGLLIDGVTRIEGKVLVPAQVYGSDDAPLNRPASFGARSAAPAAFNPGATLTISQDGGATLKVDGADLVGRQVAEAKAARDAVRIQRGFGPPSADAGVPGSLYRDVSNPYAQLEYTKTEDGWQGPQSIQGNPGGNVMAVGLLVAVDNATTIPDGVGCIQLSGGRQHGVGAHQRFLWTPPMAALDPAGEGYWWMTTNGGEKRWFAPSSEGSPEMIGAHADDGQFSHTNPLHGTDDWIYLKKAANYFSRLRLPGKYWSSKCINVLRTVDIVGFFGAEAGNYASRVRFARGCVGWFFHRSNTNADDTGKVPVLDNRAPDFSADGFSIQFVEIIMGQGDRIAYDGSNLTEHAIWHKCRGITENLRIRGAMGHAIYSYASAVSTDPMLRGNSNGSTARLVRGENLTGSVVHWEGADTNGSRSFGINGSQTGGPCIASFSFLAGTHDTPQCSNAGRDGLVYYAGYRWWCVKPALASTEAPGTGTAWFRGAATALPDSWVSGKPYYYGGAYLVGTDTERSNWENPYVEGNSGPFMSLTAVDTQCWIKGGLLNGDGAVMGNLGWLSGSGLRISGRSGVHAAFFNASFAYSGIAAQFTAHNAGAIGTTRGSAFQINIGYEADGVTQHQVARYAARSGANLAAVGEAQIDLYNPTTSGWDTKFLVQASALLPGADNAIDIGSGSRRFRQIFGATPTINTSDERAKVDILPIDDALLDAWADVEWRQFRMVDAIEAKGDDARIHTGVVAQQVRNALSAHGIDGTRYGLLCFDRWDDLWEVWGDEFEDRPAVYALDDDGNLAFDGEGNLIVVTPAERALIRPAGRELVREAGELWGIRYTEAFAVEAAYQRRRMDRIEARLAALDA